MLTQKETDRAIRNALIIDTLSTGKADIDTLGRIFKLTVRAIQKIVHESMEEMKQ